jgi:hypothetical protein
MQYPRSAFNEAQTKATTIRMISRNAADTIPFGSTGCGSPSGIPLGFAAQGRTLERLDSFDRTYDQQHHVALRQVGRRQDDGRRSRS